MFTQSLLLHPTAPASSVIHTHVRNHPRPNQELLAMSYEYPPSPRSLAYSLPPLLEVDSPTTSTQSGSTIRSKMLNESETPTSRTSSPSVSTSISAPSQSKLERNHASSPSAAYLPPPSLPTFGSSAMQNPSPQPAMNLAGRRRQSRFDPMGGDDEDEAEYEDLGYRHPLRKVKEEEGAGEAVNLPSIKSIFSLAQGHSPLTLPTASSSSTSLFQSPSLPSLIPSNSPLTSPSTTRTSRYSSLTSGSSISTNSHGFDWWASDFDRNTDINPNIASSSTKPYHRPSVAGPSSGSSPSFSFRSHGYSIPMIADEHDAKRRRSDGPLASRETEETARLRWQAQQTRTPSAPTAPSYPFHEAIVPSSSASASASTPHLQSRGVRGCLSEAPINGDPYGHASLPSSPGLTNTTPTDLRPSAAPRALSFVSGPLASSFADLSASERDQVRNRNQSISGEMLPPSLKIERKTSLFPVLNSTDRYLPSPVAPSYRTSVSAIQVNSPNNPRADHPGMTQTQAGPSAQRTGLEQPPFDRRYSLTEQIRAQSGDLDFLEGAPGPSHPFGRYSLDSSVSLVKPSSSEPLIRGCAGSAARSDANKPTEPSLAGVGRRGSADSDISLHSSHHSDVDGIVSSRPTTKDHNKTRRRKRSPINSEHAAVDVDIEQSSSNVSPAKGSSTSTSGTVKPEPLIKGTSTRYDDAAKIDSGSSMPMEPSEAGGLAGMRGMEALAEGATRLLDCTRSASTRVPGLRRVSEPNIVNQLHAKSTIIPGGLGLGDEDADDDMEGDAEGTDEEHDQLEHDADADADEHDLMPKIERGREGSPAMVVIQGPGGPKYQCGYCAKTFSRPSSLRIHTYSHTGERPFVCHEPACGRRFSVQSNLKRHAKVHQMGQAGGASMAQLAVAAAAGAAAVKHHHQHPPPQPHHSLLQHAIGSEATGHSSSAQQQLEHKGQGQSQQGQSVHPQPYSQHTAAQMQKVKIHPSLSGTPATQWRRGSQTKTEIQVAGPPGHAHPASQQYQQQQLYSHPNSYPGVPAHAPYEAHLSEPNPHSNAQSHVQHHPQSSLVDQHCSPGLMYAPHPALSSSLSQQATHPHSLHQSQYHVQHHDPHLQHQSPHRYSHPQSQQQQQQQYHHQHHPHHVYPQPSPSPSFVPRQYAHSAGHQALN